MSSARLIALAALTIAVVTACAIPGSKTVRLADQDSGRAVELRSGDRLELVLEANPTTGYTWQVDSVNSAIIRQAGEPVYTSEGAMPGSGGKLTLTFEAGAAGRTLLRLAYARPFEKDRPPIKTFDVTVTVR
jgi:inhibitor of cysteine peptidase